MKTMQRGAASGVLVGLLISIIMSAIYGNGSYYPMAPMASATIFYSKHVNELSLFIIAIITWGLIGMLFTLASAIFNKENWTTIQMALVHFLLVGICFFPLSIASGWYPLTASGIGQFFAIFILVYLIIWIIIYTKNYWHIKRINDRLAK